MHYFTNIPIAEPDPIFNLNSAFRKDLHPQKVNLGVGAYKTEELLPWVLPSVKKAEQEIIQETLDKEYLPIDGDVVYKKESAKLTFGDVFVKQEQDRLYACQTLGGTGALRLAADFLFRYASKTIFIPEPTWPNHRQVFTMAGLHVETYPYYNAKDACLNLSGILKAIKKMPKGSTILLQACCHNPTGIDPTDEEWSIIAQEIKAQELLVCFDCAYQGFSKGIDEDVCAIRKFQNLFDEMIVAISYSKNFGLYGERVGTLFCLSSDSQSCMAIESQFKVLVRTMYSNPPSHGMRLVKKILTEPSLKQEWVQDVQTMRERLLNMRLLLVKELQKNTSCLDFSFLENQHGMFSFCRLNQSQVNRLAHEFGIHMTSNGRISIAGLSSENTPYVARAIAYIISNPMPLK